MKTRASLFLLLLLFWAGPVAAGPILSFDPSITTATVGDDFTVDILIDDVDDLYGYAFGLTFDTSIVNVNSITEGDFFQSGGGLFFFPDPPEANTIDFILNSFFGDVPGVSTTDPRILLTVSFHAVGAGSSALALLTSDEFPVLLNSSLEDIGGDLQFSDGSIDVSPAEVSEVPEPTSMVLLGTGLAGFIYRRRRRSS